MHSNLLPMKRLSFLAVCVLMCMTTFAQQALWGEESLLSPEVHENNTVTFRLKAPGASKVQITGDFLPAIIRESPWGITEEAGVADMKKNSEGIWEYTTSSSLAPEFYSYFYVVDGMKIADPHNAHQIRDIATITSLFIIGGERD